MATTTEVLRDSIARIIVELERIADHLATADIEPSPPLPCQFVATAAPSVGDAGTTAAGGRDQSESAMTAPMGSGDRLLFINDVEEWTGVPVQTLRSWRQHGKGPRSAKVGARVRYREADVQAWIEAFWETT